MPTVNRVQELLDRGVVIPCPASVEVDNSIQAERIAPGAVLHTGCRLSGADTSIGPGCEIGAEAPASIENCRLGHNVSLKGGYFSGAVFLDGSSMGSAAHIRAGTILEEEANGAHAVGFKQTILMPFVTAGSLINFCDALMAGGTSRKNHSEIGSSYIHFNFTPHQDKATASLIGDVPRGVLLDRPPVFLGGQGGLTGPVRIAYGTVIPAGIICRRDILEENRLFAAPPEAPREPRPYKQGLYMAINRIVANNLIYIGNIQALRCWYVHVRRRWMERDPFRKACWSGALAQLDAVLDERLRRLGELARKMTQSLELARGEYGERLPDNPFAQQRALVERWPSIETGLKEEPSGDAAAADREILMEELKTADINTHYLKAIGLLSPRARSAATRWLQAIVDSAAGRWVKV